MSSQSIGRPTLPTLFWRPLIYLKTMGDTFLTTFIKWANLIVSANSTSASPPRLMLRLVAISKLVWTWVDPFAGVEMVAELALSADNRLRARSHHTSCLCARCSLYTECPATHLYPDSYSSFELLISALLQDTVPESQAGQEFHLQAPTAQYGYLHSGIYSVALKWCF